MLLRFNTALLSTVLCLLYIVQPSSVSIIQENGFVLPILIIIFFGYLILGIPASYLIDIANQKIVIRSSIGRYLLNVVMYGFLGIIAYYILFIFLAGELIIKESFILFGFIPSLIFYHVQLLLKGLLILIGIKKNKRIDT